MCNYISCFCVITHPWPKCHFDYISFLYSGIAIFLKYIDGSVQNCNIYEFRCIGEWPVTNWHGDLSRVCLTKKVHIKTHITFNNSQFQMTGISPWSFIIDPKPWCWVAQCTCRYCKITQTSTLMSLISGKKCNLDKGSTYIRFNGDIVTSAMSTLTFIF